MKIRQNITLDESINSKLDILSDKLGERRSKIVERALAQYFDSLTSEQTGTCLKNLPDDSRN